MSANSQKRTSHCKAVNPFSYTERLQAPANPLTSRSRGSEKSITLPRASLKEVDWPFSPRAVRIPGVMETKTEYQPQLAESLIRSVGVEEAVYFALQNQWMGILAHLPSDAPIRHH